MVGIREDTLGLGVTKPTDHTRARMVSRLAEIKAEVMCCMSTTADFYNGSGLKSGKAPSIHFSSCRW